MDIFGNWTREKRTSFYKDLHAWDSTRTVLRCKFIRCKSLRYIVKLYRHRQCLVYAYGYNSLVIYIIIINLLLWRSRHMHAWDSFIRNVTLTHYPFPFFFGLFFFCYKENKILKVTDFTGYTVLLPAKFYPPPFKFHFSFFTVNKSSGQNKYFYISLFYRTKCGQYL